MCLIAIKPKGKYAYEEIFIEGLITSSKNNSDGIGFAYKKDGEAGVHFEKGFTEIRPFIDKLRSLDIKEKDELIIHLRRASTGNKDISNCHPFVLTSTDKDIDGAGPCKTYNTLMFHNGHLSSFIDGKKEHSDTYMFAKLFMRNRDVKELLRKDKDLFLQCFGSLIKPERNRMVFMSEIREQNIITIGNFIEDKGYLFSNLSYKNGDLINSGGIDIIPNKNYSPIKGFNLSNSHIDRMQERLDNLLGHKVDVPDLIISANNFFEVILIANKDVEYLSIKKDEKWTISKWMPESKFQQLLLNFDKPSEFAWVDMKSLREDFIAVPKLAFMNKYKDYYRLIQLIKPTKSAIKKIHDKINSIAGRKGKWPEPDDIIDIKYKNRPFSLRYDSICMFIRDHIIFLGGYANIPTLKGETAVVGAETSVNKNKEVVTKLQEFRDLKKTLINKTEEELSKEIIDNEKVVNESLKEFKKKREKEIEDSNSHLNGNLIANKVDSNNGEEDNSQEKKELELAKIGEEGLNRCSTN